MVLLSSRCKILTCIDTLTQADVGKLTGRYPRIVRLGIKPELHSMSRTDNTFRIGYLGQLDHRKRVDILIKSFIESGAKGELVIAGQGQELNNLKGLAQEHTNIRFLGYVPDDELLFFYNSLDLFIMPTKSEGYCLPIVEAMACGKPVVVLEDSNIPIEVRSRCIIISNLGDLLRDWELLYNKIVSINIEDNEKWARSHSWDKCAEEYEELYKRILKKT
jgi:glycosyltransferase involved in cell wall biosynthesis